MRSQTYNLFDDSKKCLSTQKNDNFLIQHNFARFYIYRTILFVHDKIFDLARNRARSHDKIFIVISNPGLELDLMPILADQIRKIIVNDKKRALFM